MLGLPQPARPPRRRSERPGHPWGDGCVDGQQLDPYSSLTQRRREENPRGLLPGAQAPSDRGTCLGTPRGSDAGESGRGPTACISNKFPGDADTAGLHTTLRTTTSIA